MCLDRALRTISHGYRRGKRMYAWNALGVMSSALVVSLALGGVGSVVHWRPCETGGMVALHSTAL